MVFEHIGSRRKREYELHFTLKYDEYSSLLNGLIRGSSLIDISYWSHNENLCQI